MCFPVTVVRHSCLYVLPPSDSPREPRSVEEARSHPGPIHLGSVIDHTTSPTSPTSVFLYVNFKRRNELVQEDLRYFNPLHTDTQKEKEVGEGRKGEKEGGLRLVIYT